MPEAPLPPLSPLVRRFMAGWFARYLTRHLDALRLPVWSASPGADHPGAVVVYCNHPSWWDALVVILIGAHLYPGRESRAPFDARMLAKYRIFERLGAFGVDLDSPRGAAQFLGMCRRILSRRDQVLCVTAQGRFQDARARPLALRPGIARLPEIAPDALFVPLALDYAFWDERGAGAFAAFGPGMTGAELAALPRAERLARLEGALTDLLDRLSADVIGRDPARFRTLIAGRRGVGGVYDLWRRAAARLRGHRFHAGHGAPEGGRPE